MNVYDFDKTIVPFDSTRKFYLFLLRRHPRLWLDLPRQGFYAILFGLRLMKKTAFKEKFYAGFRLLRDIGSEVALFWERNKQYALLWYPGTRKPDDVVISASPTFLLEPIMKELSVGCLMASRVDPKTGKTEGLNCHGEEKVRRFYEVFPEGKVDDFFSDSLSDTPLARLAENAFLVKGAHFTPWPSK